MHVEPTNTEDHLRQSRGGRFKYAIQKMRWRCAGIRATRIPARAEVTFSLCSYKLYDMHASNLAGLDFNPSEEIHNALSVFNTMHAEEIHISSVCCKLKCIGIIVQCPNQYVIQ